METRLTTNPTTISVGGLHLGLADTRTGLLGSPRSLAPRKAALVSDGGKRTSTLRSSELTMDHLSPAPITCIDVISKPCPQTDLFPVTH